MYGSAHKSAHLLICLFVSYSINGQWMVLCPRMWRARKCRMVKCGVNWSLLVTCTSMFRDRRLSSITCQTLCSLCSTTVISALRPIVEVFMELRSSNRSTSSCIILNTPLKGKLKIYFWRSLLENIVVQFWKMKLGIITLGHTFGFLVWCNGF